MQIDLGYLTWVFLPYPGKCLEKISTDFCLAQIPNRLKMVIFIFHHTVRVVDIIFQKVKKSDRSSMYVHGAQMFVVCWLLCVSSTSSSSSTTNMKPKKKHRMHDRPIFRRSRFPRLCVCELKFDCFCVFMPLCARRQELIHFIYWIVEIIFVDFFFLCLVILNRIVHINLWANRNINNSIKRQRMNEGIS